jgi:para-nitrobenzyl esterase
MARSIRPLPACAVALALLAGCAGDAPPPQAPPTADPATRAETTEGPVDGFVDRAGVHAWLGVPYAAPPVGDRRWRAPRPPAARPEVLAATAFGAACPQMGSPLGGAPESAYGELWGDEDCLTVNLWAPAEAEGAPVLLWIHGGGNTVGHSGFYDGGPLAAAHDVVVVTLNYRLGTLGWFHHPALDDGDPRDASGNYGTLDAIRALEWVRDNVAAFGGDPAKVTVFGESAGATNVASLVVSPLAEGLFRGAIMQSGGTSSATLARAAHYRDHADAPGADNSSAEVLLRTELGADCDRACAKRRIAALDDAAIAERLRALSVPALFDLLEGEGGLGPGGPTVLRDGTVLPEAPFIERLGDPQRSIGTNRDEPKIFMAFSPEHVVRAFGLPLWRRDARLYELHAEYGALAWKLRGVDGPARALRAHEVPVWTYRWDWDEEGRLAFVDLSALLGAAHGLEIPFVFGHFDVGPQSGLLFHDDNAAGRIALSERMMAYWVAFARDLDPGTGADGAGPRWAPFAPERGATFLRLDAGPGGIAMDDGALDFDGLIERLASDGRIEDDAERCAIFAGAFRFDGSAEIADAARRLGCPEAG